MKKNKKTPFFRQQNIENLYFVSDNSHLNGETSIPGDKSISQRALIIALISTGTTKIENVLLSEDVLHTKKAVQTLGANLKKQKDNLIELEGIGLGNLLSPKQPIYMGNSGTGTRLLIGLVAGSNAIVTFYGDDSLSNRPMDRIVLPLKRMGAKFICNNGFKLPITVKGALASGFTLPINYKMPVPSAQIKSSIMFAALTGRGKTTIVERIETRNNTETMFANCGIKVESKKNKKEKKINIGGVSYINAKDVIVPGDPSSAAFIVVAAIITKQSNVVVKGVFYNKFRLKIFEILKKMGANINIIKAKNKHYCDIHAKYSKLKNIRINSSFNTALIDEFPILSIAAATASGKMVMTNLEELRYKESDRLNAIFKGLSKCGVVVASQNNDLIIEGNDNILGGCNIDAKQDHRIAMSFNILSLISEEPIFVDGNNSIKTSFPNFFELLSNLGVKIGYKNAL